jgi:hypothetical protein
MIHASSLHFLVLGTSTSLLAYSITIMLSGFPIFLNQAIAQQDSGNEDGGGEIQLSDVSSSRQCLPGQHIVQSTNECEWDNCGSAVPPMYRNTQTGRCVSDCSEVGQLWVEQGNVCVLGGTGGPSPTESVDSLPSIEGDEIRNETVLTDAGVELSSDNATTSSLTSNMSSTPSTLAQPVSRNATTSSLTSNMSSTPSTLAQTVAGLAGEPQLPYACFSNTFTCYCDGTEDCKRLTSSGECKAEVRSVEGEPGLGRCEWNVES